MDFKSLHLWSLTSFQAEYLAFTHEYLTVQMCVCRIKTNEWTYFANWNVQSHRHWKFYKLQLKVDRTQFKIFYFCRVGSYVWLIVYTHWYPPIFLAESMKISTLYLTAQFTNYEILNRVRVHVVNFY